MIELNADVEALRLNLHLSRNNIKKNTESIKELEAMMAGTKAPVAAAAVVSSSDSNIDINALGQLFASQGQIKDLEARLDALDGHNQG